MIFLPYRVDMKLHRYPILTFIVCVICIYVFLQQLNSLAEYRHSVQNFCSSGVDNRTIAVLRNIVKAKSGTPCKEVFLSIRDSEDPESTMQAMIRQAKPLNLFKAKEAERDYMLSILKTGYERFDRAVPSNLTEELQFNPAELEIKPMITAVFSHGSWSHLIFNLIFFFAFAASVEIIIGSLTFVFIILTMAVTTGFTYAFAVSGTSAAIPTVGLSGVVMGMMALLAVLTPKVKIRCFFWFVFVVRFFSVPALLLAAGYVGWDIYRMLSEEGTQINFIAHVSGAVTGLLIGALYWWIRPEYLRHINAYRKKPKTI